MKEKIGILNLGCPRNIVDAENILGRLKDKGYQIVDMEKADIAIINTCAFIEDAKKESVEAILDLIDFKKEGRLKKIIVAGCLSQRYQDKLRRQLPEVDAFVGTASLNHSLSRFSITPRHYAYLKICESCLRNCSFCIIPKIKGKFQSLDPEAVLKRAKIFGREKISELNIIGQDISAYGRDLYGQSKLPQVVRKIAKTANNIGWIRLLYLYPDKSLEKLFKVIKNEDKICKYIDLPLQHINNRILKLMRRNSTEASIRKLIASARKNIPGVAIRTSLIVGFPSETDKEFNQLLEFIKEAKFERLGVFQYSREEGTSAYNFKPQIPQRVKETRFNALMSAQQDIAEEVNAKFLGQDLKVLIDEKFDDHYLARTEYDAPEVDGNVFVKSRQELSPGDFTKVKITGTLKYDLIGEACR